MLKGVVAGFSLAVMLGGAASAGQLEDGVAAFKDGDYVTAFKLWQQAADAGDPVAIFNVALSYEKGYGVAKNGDEAVKWYKRAAAKGDVVSEFKLGLIFAEGVSVPQNYTSAAQWYIKAAGNNHVRAQVNLGTLYANGRGVPQDASKAFELYERAENTACSYGDTAAAEAPRVK
jgi:TPR repeat protein